MTRFRTVLLAAACVAALAALGCDQTAWILSETLGPLLPEEEVEPEFSFAGKSVLVLVDVGEPTVGDAFPRLQRDITRHVVTAFEDEQATGPLVPAHAVETARRSEPDFRRWSVVEVGQYFNVDYVLHVVIYDFRVRESPTSSVLDGFAESTISIVSPQRGAQVWPQLASARQVSARTLPDVEPIEDPIELERVLAEGLADKIARHFYTYKPGRLPLRPKVR